MACEECNVVQLIGYVRVVYPIHFYFARLLQQVFYILTCAPRHISFCQILLGQKGLLGVSFVYIYIYIYKPSHSHPASQSRSY